MTVQNAKNAEFRFTGKHMLICMVLFFGTIIAVNFTMAYLASGSWTGLVVKNSYVASQSFNTELLAAKEQTKTGVRSEVSYQNGLVTVALFAKGEIAKSLKNGSLWAGRPASEHLDRTVAVSCGTKGSCAAKLDLAPGAWMLRLNGSVDGRPYRRDLRLWISGDGRARTE